MKFINIRRQLLAGAGWSIATRWGIKGMGFLSTLIMARLLVPADFGVVAMAMLVVGLIQSFLDFGTDTAILRQSTLEKKFTDSAWSLRIIQGSVIAAMIAAAGPIVAQFFHEPRLVGLLVIFGGCIIFAGASNIGITIARKELNFSLEFRYNLLAKALGVIATIIAALILGDYRALVIGIVTGYVSGFALSYLMHPYRPRWCTTHFKPIWMFSRWILVSGIASFAVRRADEFIAGRISDSHGFGLYNVGADIGQLATAELGPPLLRTLLPVLSAIQGDTERVRRTAVKVLGAINTLTLPAGVGLACVALPATHLLLGSHWLEAAPFVAVFGLIGALKIAAGPLPSLIILHGHSKIQATLTWFEFLVFFVAMVGLIPQFGLMGLAYARLISSAMVFLATIWMSRKVCGIGFRSVGTALWRPLSGVVVMGAVLVSVPFGKDIDILGFIIVILLGAMVYIVWVISTWLMNGRPEGLEELIFDKLRSMLKRPHST
jgi:lipopolysaccharide exporter